MLLKSRNYSICMMCTSNKSSIDMTIVTPTCGAPLKRSLDGENRKCSLKTNRVIA